MVIAPRNFVLVSPEKDFSELNGLSVEVLDARNFNPFARVVSVPSSLFFKRRHGSRHSRQNERFQRINGMSLDWGTRQELSVGDLVMLHYKAKADSEMFDDGNLLVEYTMVIARVVDGRLIPVNGNVLVEVPDIEDGNNSATTGGYGTVTAVSRYRNSGYKLSIKRDRFDPPAGSHIFFNAKQAYPVEFGGHSRFGKLVAIKRKDILLWK